MKIKVVLAALTILALSVIAVPRVNALSLASSISMTDGCVSLVDGERQKSQSVPAGESINITVGNDDGVVAQSVSGQGVPAGSRLGPNKRDPVEPSAKTFTVGVVNSPVTLTFTPIPSADPGMTFINYCPEGSTPQASTLTLVPATATNPNTSVSSPPNRAPSTPAPNNPAVPEPTNPKTTDQLPNQPDGITLISAEVAKSPSPTTKIMIGLVVLFVLAVIALAIRGHIPVKKYWNRITGIKKKPTKKPTKPRKRKR